MMPLDLWITTLLGVGILVVSVLEQLAYWQRKEYRWDRMRSYLRSAEGSLTKQPEILGVFLVIGVGWFAYLLMWPLLAIAAGYIALIALIVCYALRIKRKGLERPKLTQKIILLSVVEVVLLLLFIRFAYVADEFTALQWSTFYLFLPVITGVAVVIAEIPTAMRKKQIINEAAAIRKKNKDVTVVGITGSYGKTSTKYFLTQILEKTDSKFAVTKEHRNSHIGVALDMKEQLHPKVEIYIAEMGAYTKGEVKDLAVLAKPSIGVITAIGNQHIDLFGSKENIAKAKWELIDALPQDGAAVLNAADELLTAAAKTYTGKILWYSLKKTADVYMSSLNVRSRSIAGVLHFGPHSAKVEIPLLSKGLLGSVLAAVCAAHALGVGKQAIVQALAELKPFERTMEIKKGMNACTVIDDSYSGGEVAAKNAIEHLSLFSMADKRIVFVPIIELGVEGSRVHREIGELLGNSGANVFVYGDMYRQELQAGFNAASVNKKGSISWYTDPLLLVEKTTLDLSAQSLLLLEGRTPAILRKTLF